jgi:hypothetical protein
MATAAVIAFHNANMAQERERVKLRIANGTKASSPEVIGARMMNPSFKGLPHNSTGSRNAPFFVNTNQRDHPFTGLVGGVIKDYRYARQLLDQRAKSAEELRALREGVAQGMPATAVPGPLLELSPEDSRTLELNQVLQTIQDLIEADGLESLSGSVVMELKNILRLFVSLIPTFTEDEFAKYSEFFTELVQVLEASQSQAASASARSAIQQTLTFFQRLRDFANRFTTTVRTVPDFTEQIDVDPATGEQRVIRTQTGTSTRLESNLNKTPQQKAQIARSLLRQLFGINASSLRTARSSLQGRQQAAAAAAAAAAGGVGDGDDGDDGAGGGDDGDAGDGAAGGDYRQGMLGMYSEQAMMGGPGGGGGDVEFVRQQLASRGQAAAQEASLGSMAAAAGPAFNLPASSSFGLLSPRPASSASAPLRPPVFAAAAAPSAAALRGRLDSEAALLSSSAQSAAARRVGETASDRRPNIGEDFMRRPAAAAAAAAEQAGEEELDAEEAALAEELALSRGGPARAQPAQMTVEQATTRIDDILGSAELTQDKKRSELTKLVKSDRVPIGVLTAMALPSRGRAVYANPQSAGAAASSFRSDLILNAMLDKALSQSPEAAEKIVEELTRQTGKGVGISIALVRARAAALGPQWRDMGAPAGVNSVSKPIKAALAKLPVGERVFALQEAYRAAVPGLLRA